MDTEAAVAMLTDRAIDAFGRIDLLVSTLGGAPYPLSFDAISEAQLLETFRLNTWPAVALIRAALDRGLGDNGGVGRDHLERFAAQDDVGHGVLRVGEGGTERDDPDDRRRPRAGRVRVNAVSPGLVRTTATRPHLEVRWRCGGRRQPPASAG